MDHENKTEQKLPELKRTGEYWFYVVQQLKHLESSEVGKRTWWCIDSRSKPGDIAVIYQSAPTRAVIMLLQVVGKRLKDESLCSMYGMTTATVEVIHRFDPPITARELKEHPRIKDEGFTRRNFQGKSFHVHQPEAMTEFLKRWIALD
ncbi:MAG: EVE domain-containing protein [Cyanobacteria bacterium HKST-UBA02]|nr:EVE domain-containing protein [Cyanobacteria bacterium HKST-UBA02]